MRWCGAYNTPAQCCADCIGSVLLLRLPALEPAPWSKCSQLTSQRNTRTVVELLRFNHFAAKRSPPKIVKNRSCIITVVYWKLYAETQHSALDSKQKWGQMKLSGYLQTHFFPVIMWRKCEWVFILLGLLLTLWPPEDSFRSTDIPHGSGPPQCDYRRESLLRHLLTIN